jgi:hypothetical protein
MLHRRQARLPGDNPLLRRAFARERDLGAEPFHRHFPAALRPDYEGWLCQRGIEPQTGRMTPAGLAFFKSLLDGENRRCRRAR